MRGKISMSDFKVICTDVLAHINTVRGTNYTKLKPKQEEVLYSLISNPDRDGLAVLKTGYGWYLKVDNALN